MRDLGEGVESWKQRGLVERKGSLHFGCPATRFLLKLKESGNSRPQGTCSTARPPFAEAVSCGGTRPLVIDAQEAFARAHSGAGQGLCAAAEVGSAPRLVAGRGEQGRLSETVTALRAPRVPGPWTRTTGCRTCRRAQLSTRTLRSGTRLELVTVSG